MTGLVKKIWNLIRSLAGCKDDLNDLRSSIEMERRNMPDSEYRRLTSLSNNIEHKIERISGVLTRKKSYSLFKKEYDQHPEYFDSDDLPSYSSLSGLLGTFKDKALEALDQVGNFAKETVKYVGDFTSNAANTFKGYAKQTVDYVGNTVTNAAKKTVQYVGDVASTAAGAVGEFAKKTAETVGSFANKAVDVGEFILDGNQMNDFALNLAEYGIFKEDAFDFEKHVDDVEREAVAEEQVNWEVQQPAPELNMGPAIKVDSFEAPQKAKTPDINLKEIERDFEEKRSQLIKRNDEVTKKIREFNVLNEKIMAEFEGTEKQKENVPKKEYLTMKRQFGLKYIEIIKQMIDLIKENINNLQENIKLHEEYSEPLRKQEEFKKYIEEDMKKLNEARQELSTYENTMMDNEKMLNTIEKELLQIEYEEKDETRSNELLNNINELLKEYNTCTQKYETFKLQLKKIIREQKHLVGRNELYSDSMLIQLKSELENRFELINIMKKESEIVDKIISACEEMLKLFQKYQTQEIGKPYETLLNNNKRIKNALTEDIEKWSNVHIPNLQKEIEETQKKIQEREQEQIYARNANKYVN